MKISIELIYLFGVIAGIMMQTIAYTITEDILLQISINIIVYLAFYLLTKTIGES